MNFYKTKEDITDWLDEHKVRNYTLVEDPTYGYTIEVKGSVDLSRLRLTEIPVKFNHVGGSFYCHNNQLTSLEFCPTNVGGGFYCGYNQLTSLKFCPTNVGGDFICCDNQLTSLEFFPTQVGCDFSCSGNPALPDVQNIRDFSKILAIHKETLIKIEKQQINKQLKQIVAVNNIDNISNKVLFKL